ncbi:MAG: hypothetical protein KKA76_07175 [Proteobacteria bacterium]|nr:hypothetical protein [Pseudomonadota bacterium]
MKSLMTMTALFCCMVLSAGLAYGASTVQISKDTSGGAPDGNSRNPGVSADGRYVVFQSSATDLVSDDTNGFDDIFVYDTGADTMTRVSLGYDGGGSGDPQLTGGSDYPAISGDGKYVTFSTHADDVINYSNYQQIFVHNMEGTYNNQVLVSKNTSNGEANNNSYQSVLSYNGKYIAFESDATDLTALPGPVDGGGNRDIFVREMESGTTYLVSRNTSGEYANGFSSNPSISNDGTLIAFQSSAYDLVAGDVDDGFSDVFVLDGPHNTMELISKAYGGGTSDGYSSYPHISGNGRYVAFQSVATNLVENDTNGGFDIFLHDRETGVTEIVSVDQDGNQVTDHGTNGYAGGISADGRYVTFSTPSASLVDADTNGVADIFLRDMKEKKTVRVSIGNGGEEPDQYVYAQYMDVTDNGLTAVFSTWATNLGGIPTDSKQNVFMRKDAYDPSFPWTMFLPATTKMTNK